MTGQFPHMVVWTKLNISEGFREGEQFPRCCVVLVPSLHGGKHDRYHTPILEGWIAKSVVLSRVELHDLASMSNYLQTIDTDSHRSNKHAAQTSLYNRPISSGEEVHSQVDKASLCPVYCRSRIVGRARERAMGS